MQSAPSSCKVLAIVLIILRCPSAHMSSTHPTFNLPAHKTSSLLLTRQTCRSQDKLVAAHKTSSSLLTRQTCRSQDKLVAAHKKSSSLLTTHTCHSQDKLVAAHRTSFLLLTRQADDNTRHLGELRARALQGTAACRWRQMPRWARVGGRWPR